MIRHSEYDIVGARPKRDELADLPLFTAPVTVSVSTPSPKREARRRADASGGRARVLEALRQSAHGLTRWEIHHATGLPINSVNARVAELIIDLHAEVRGARKTPDNVGRLVDGSVVVLLSGDAR